MRLRTRDVILGIAVALGSLPAPAQAQLPPPPPPPATLWSFLGIPQGYRSFRDNAFNRSGNRPNLERKPPLKAIADPKNLASADPSIKKAAEVKQAEDLAPQKIKAVKYLASIGCGCYNRDGSITDALIKSMDDCTEAVRLATVQAISEAAAGEMCSNCKMRSCCSEEISNKLYEIAYERDDTGCYLEPSERVRLAAAEALRTCCPNRDEDFFIEMAPTPAPVGGERPGVVPETGGERPGTVVPPPAVEPAPIPGNPPITPIPPTRVLPPVVPPPVPAPAPASQLPSVRRSSRRTVETAPLAPQSNELPPVISGPTAATEGPSQPLFARETPHWNPTNIRACAANRLQKAQAVLADAPSSIAATSDNQRSDSDGGIKLSPSVRSATLTRLPPIDGSSNDMVPAPPLPAAGTPALPVSTRRPPMPAQPPADSAVQQASSSESEGRAESKRPRVKIPFSQRVIPGAQFGTGMVKSVRLKEGVAYLEFSNDTPVPAGSVIRAYHEYAISGKTPICDLEVLRDEGGLAVVIARPGSELTNLAVGDRALVLR